ncbi:hypothetical protein CEXT_630651 [Caerostris extrusa]|uniref:Uncharacterized protein n=1 Tax=Caerostris extrusa TaxID=172846 RepID=A0AAV4WKZ9_CAEEX|nr:hypothetical protein CEXT_630651 [Caerostris extrusa]
MDGFSVRCRITLVFHRTDMKVLILIRLSNLKCSFKFKGEGLQLYLTSSSPKSSQYQAHRYDVKVVQIQCTVSRPLHP